jgi:hypothetical protein
MIVPVGESLRDSQIPGNVEWCVNRHDKFVRFETGVAEVVRFQSDDVVRTEFLRIRLPCLLTCLPQFSCERMRKSPQDFRFTDPANVIQSGRLNAALTQHVDELGAMVGGVHADLNQGIDNAKFQGRSTDQH